MDTLNSSELVEVLLDSLSTAQQQKQFMLELNKKSFIIQFQTYQSYEDEPRRNIAIDIIKILFDANYSIYLSNMIHRIMNIQSIMDMYILINEL